MKQNPFSHTCSCALLSSPEYLNPQSAGWCKLRALLCLFMPSHSYNCCYHSKYMLSAWYTQEHLPPARTLPGTKEPDQNNCRAFCFQSPIAPDSENNGISPRSSQTAPRCNHTEPRFCHLENGKLA